MDNLTGKHIVLGITGSIAAYKSALIARLLIKAGAEVQVIMTPSAKEFITPLTMSTLTRKPVVSEFFDRRDGSWHSHVDLGQWADAMLIAPCSASTIGKMAGGIADNMLVTTYLSMKAPVFIAPAMDLDMYRHPSTQRNLEVLKSYGNTIIEPAEGELASQLVGKGRMEEPEIIVQALESFFTTDELKDRKILITAGPTYEPIDPVRFIGNHSTGKMGFALAEECASRGAQVTLIAGPVNLKCIHPAIRRIDVRTAHEMYNAAMAAFPESNAAILCAAVADFTPQSTSDSKIKRKGEITLGLKPTEDIAASLGAVKKPEQRMVGFALETNDEFTNAQGKLEKKNLDFIVLNSLRDAGAGFGYDTNKVTLIDRNGSDSLPLQSKKDVAKAIISKLAGMLGTLLFLLLPSLNLNAQELAPTITVNATKIQGTNREVFRTLESDLNEFMANQAWTDYKFSDAEKIRCSFAITVNTYEANSGKFECEMAVQSSRPVYGSTYQTTVFNFHDSDVGFNFTAQDRLDYTPGNSPDNNLIAIMAFYSYLIIGLDFDTMALNGGSDILRQAENIAAGAGALGGGWRSFDSNTNRYTIISDYMNGNLSAFRQLFYDYHRKGLDDMSGNADRGRGTITQSLDLLVAARQAKNTSVLPTLFTEIKKDELVNIYSKGLAKEKEKVASLLTDINPSLSEDWNTIKNRQ